MKKDPGAGVEAMTMTTDPEVGVEAMKTMTDPEVRVEAMMTTKKTAHIIVRQSRMTMISRVVVLAAELEVIMKKMDSTTSNVALLEVGVVVEAKNAVTYMTMVTAATIQMKDKNKNLFYQKLWNAFIIFKNRQVREYEGVDRYQREKKSPRVHLNNSESEEETIAFPACHLDAELS